MRHPLAFLIAAVIAVGCVQPGESGAPSAVATDLASPEPTAGSVASPQTPAPATAGPTAGPTARPSTAPSPGLAGLVPTPIDPTIELQVQIHGDVGGGRTPALVVFVDGTVLRSVHDGEYSLAPRISRLTQDGVRQVKARARNSGLFSESGSLPPDPDYQGGFMGYAIDLRVGDEVIHRGTTNVLTAATRQEGEAIIALAERLARADRWLPADAWTISPDDAVPYVPKDLLLKISITKQPWPNGPNDPDRPASDVADVAWPLDGELHRFGERIDDVEIADVHRCGTLTLAQAAQVETALNMAGWTEPRLPAAEFMYTTLTWDAQGWVVTASLHILLPNDPLDCAADGSWF